MVFLFKVDTNTLSVQLTSTIERIILTQIEEDNQTYLRLHRYLMDDFLNHELTFDEMILLIWLQWKANPVNGTIHISYAGLVADFQNRYSKNHINKIMLSLKQKQYLWFLRQMGRRGSFIVELHYYPLSDRDFKDISHRFGQSPGKDSVVPPTASVKTQARVLAEVAKSRQKFPSNYTPLDISLSSSIFNTAGRGSKNENENKKEKENDNLFSISDEEGPVEGVNNHATGYSDYDNEHADFVDSVSDED